MNKVKIALYLIKKWMHTHIRWQSLKASDSHQNNFLGWLSPALGDCHLVWDFFQFGGQLRPFLVLIDGLNPLFESDGKLLVLSFPFKRVSGNSKLLEKET